MSESTGNWAKCINSAKTAQSLGALVFAPPWNPPTSMSEQFNGCRRSGKRLKYDKYGDYAQHLNNFVKYMKENGVEFYAISIQNEPDYASEECKISQPLTPIK